MSERKPPQKGEQWVHAKTQNLYDIVTICTIEKNLVPAVAYRRSGYQADPTVWIRPLAEFMSLNDEGANRFNRFTL